MQNNTNDTNFSDKLNKTNIGLITYLVIFTILTLLALLYFFLFSKKEVSVETPQKDVSKVLNNDKIKKEIPKELDSNNKIDIDSNTVVLDKDLVKENTDKPLSNSDSADSSDNTAKSVVNLENKKTMTVEDKLQFKEPTLNVDSTKNYQANIKTNLGDIVLDLDVKNTPITANNFIELANAGFYNDVIFHRVIDGFMVQGGDPLGSGTGGPAYKFNDEINISVNKNDTYTISMANAGPNTNGSQFFINVNDNNFLDSKHTVFGKVVKGMDIVQKIATTPTGFQDRPVEDVIMELVTITTK